MARTDTPSTAAQRINTSTCHGHVITAVASGAVPAGNDLDAVEVLAELVEGYVNGLIYRGRCLDAMAADQPVPAPDERTPTGERLAAIARAFLSAADLAEKALASKPGPLHRAA